VIPRPPPPDDDAWHESEQPIRYAIVAELKRIKRRSRARLGVILAITTVLTAGVVYKRTHRVKIHEAEVVVAVTEGALGDGHVPMPVNELREYVGSVLLSNQVLQKVIEEEDLFPLRHKLGMEYAINELRDLFSIGIHRNYFLSEYSIDAPRSARISVEFSHPDPAFASRMAHRLATLIVEGEQAHRRMIADEMARQAALGLADAREHAAAIEQEVVDKTAAVTRAQDRGERREAGALKVEVAEAEAKLREADKEIAALTRQANVDEMAVAIDRAGLGMRFDIVEAKRPLEQPPAGLYFQIIVGALAFFILLPIVATFVGAFDTRIHDREDAERIGLPVLGHLPGFPGDDVGSLRARGLRGRRVPS